MGCHTEATRWTYTNVLPVITEAEVRPQSKKKMRNYKYLSKLAKL